MVDIPVRRLTRNREVSSTSPSSEFRVSQTLSKKKSATPSIFVGKSASASVPASPKTEAAGHMETANSMLQGRQTYGSILEGYVYTDSEVSESQSLGDRTKDLSLNRIYRDIYYHDPVCGGSIDMISNMPFSDFALGGAKDKKVYAKFEESIQNTNVKQLHTQLSQEYLVHGLFCGTTVFDDKEGTYTGIIPQNITFVDVLPVPIFGRDPLITLQVGEAAKALKAYSGDDRMKEYSDLLSPKDAVAKPNPEDVIYIPRRGLLRDIRGVSILKRVLTVWMIERSLYRGTLDQSMKRQKPITQVTVGEPEWTPTQEDMQAIANNLLAADQDPVGAIFMTRTGVNVSDIRSSGDLWKVSDLESFFTTAKLRAMGVSEAFLNGDANYNSMEQAMTVFIEQMRSFREMVTYELYYDRMFPRISLKNDFTSKRWMIAETASGEDTLEDELYSIAFNRPYMPHYGNDNLYGSQLDMFKETAALRHDQRDLFIPQVHWFKRLRPEADSEYLNVLTTLEEKNIPIPLRVWAAAGGLDLNSILQQEADDTKIREKIKAWVKKIKPAEEEGAGGGGGMDLSAVLTASDLHTLKKNRDYSNMDTAPANLMGDGKRRLSTRKGEKIATEKLHKVIASVAADLNGKLNAINTRLDKAFMENNSTTKHYT